MVTGAQDRPEVVSTFPEAGDSDARPFPRPATHRVPEGRAPKLRARLGWEVGFQLTNPRRREGQGRGWCESEELEPRRRKSEKAGREFGGARGCAAAAGARALTLCPHPARKWGLRGSKGRARKPNT